MRTDVKRVILCPLANDAQVGNNRYDDIGPNTALRLDEAINYARRLYGVRQTWAFGAGANVGFRAGHTLAALTEVRLREQIPEATALTNHLEHSYYGTLEEMMWVVSSATKQYPQQPLEFVFFTQRGHIARVRLIKALFFPRLQARFVTTRHMPGCDISVLSQRELLAYSRLVLIRSGLLATRVQPLSLTSFF